jgi:hypothetical protein
MDLPRGAASASSSALAWLTLTGNLAGGFQSGVALGVPLLHALLANLVDLGARLAQLVGIFRGAWPRLRRWPSAHLRAPSVRARRFFSVAVKRTLHQN